MLLAFVSLLKSRKKPEENTMRKRLKERKSATPTTRNTNMMLANGLRSKLSLLLPSQSNMSSV